MDGWLGSDREELELVLVFRMPAAAAAADRASSVRRATLQKSEVAVLEVVSGGAMASSSIAEG